MALEANTMAEAFRELRERSVSEKTGEPPMLQIELAERLNITPSNVSRVENPEINQRPSDELLERLAATFPDLTDLEELEALRDRSPPPNRTPFADRSSPNATRAARQLARERRLDLRGVRGTGEEGRILKSDVEAELRALPHEHGDGITHRAWELARSREVDVTTIDGRGPGGRIELDDVRRALGEAPADGRRRDGRPARGGPIDPFAGGRAPPAPTPAEGPSPGGDLVTDHLPEIHALATSLSTREQTDDHLPISVRFVVAASLALEGMDRALAAPDAPSARATHRAAAGQMIDDLWRLASRYGAGTPLAFEAGDEEERSALEALLGRAGARDRACRHLLDRLPAVLFPGGGEEVDRTALRTALLRSFTVGARR